MKKQAQSSADSPEKQEPKISVFSILIMSLFIGLIAGAGVDTSYILPIALISAVVLIVNRNKIVTVDQSDKNARPHVNPVQSYYTWPELDQFACTIAAAPFQKVISQLIQENVINPDNNSITQTHILKAHLIPDSSNPFDTDVVHIDINGRSICYLSREESTSLCSRLNEKKLSNQITICNAIISWSSETNKKTLCYTVKLDIEPFLKK
ncbi:hypothetical protein [Nitrosomonas supralitoralis]|uniref:Uncharacterized protein n=1 Tax=Nitrosomonas supralitoralis TaxID=2116706 RepID=A0A2P7NXZ8_9PROT|nr:hypothetical protein [Nitrosomonas supralitoralis]PSJ18350.1 hypothetical protein C7H79_02975 [Nitrosomonas supralitoralis]